MSVDALRDRAEALLELRSGGMPFNSMDREFVISLMIRFAMDAIVGKLIKIENDTQ